MVHIRLARNRHWTLKQSSYHGIKACRRDRNQVSVARRWQLTSRWCLLQVACQPGASWEVRKRLKSVDLTLPTVLVAGYDATAGSLRTILSAVPISRPVTSIFLDPLRSIWLASDLQQTPACCRLSPHVFRHLTPISSTPAYKRWGHGATNA